MTSSTAGLHVDERLTFLESDVAMGKLSAEETLRIALEIIHGQWRDEEKRIDDLNRKLEMAKADLSDVQGKLNSLVALVGKIPEMDRAIGTLKKFAALCE